ncbi:hypothetical protein B0H34DRAFT_810676 [Crassisporium funariophilum]|nr:hypothetical protein B0H34DRAFT_810676 [Crassisporium funariophilum]
MPNQRPMTRHTSDRPVLVVAIDIGTTYSAVSFCISYKGKPPDFVEVNNWPKQAFPDAKIPSVLYYDHLNTPRLCGPEAEDEDSLINAEEQHWMKAEWWKLLLRPDYLPMPDEHVRCPLPPGLNVDNIFRDFFAYIMKHIQKFIAKSYQSGDKHWEQLSASMFVVLTTPNGWEGKHQNRMREAAVNSGLVDEKGRDRVRFVSEGEAAMHHALSSSRSHDWFTIGDVILVCDTGGGTTDIGIYSLCNLAPLRLEEISGPRCFVAGGIFVNMAAKKFMEQRLKGTNLSSPETIESALRNFERFAKRQFSGQEDYSFVKLENTSQSDAAHGISRGRLKISCAEMSSFFDRCVQIVLQGLEESIFAGGPIVNKVIVVGGFADSPYVLSKIEDWCRQRNISVKKPDGPTSKVIAHGALRWHIQSGIQSRIAKFHYGAEINIAYDPSDPSMIGREIYKNVNNEWRIRYAWKEIVAKNTKLKLGEELTSWFHLEFRNIDDLEVEVELYAYRWMRPPIFIRTPDGNTVNGFIHIGTVKGNLRRYFNLANYSKGDYKTLQYEVCLSFDEIEIKAALRWKEHGAYARGEATIVYDI